jgi:hypothetical protein
MHQYTLPKRKRRRIKDMVNGDQKGDDMAFDPLAEESLWYTRRDDETGSSVTAQPDREDRDNRSNHQRRRDCRKC